MKILESPSNPELVWPRIFRCPQCKALLELEVEDIRRSTDWTGDFNSYFVECPCCRELPDVPTDWWPTVARLKT